MCMYIVHTHSAHRDILQKLQHRTYSVMPVQGTIASDQYLLHPCSQLGCKSLTVITYRIPNSYIYIRTYGDICIVKYYA